MGLQTFAQHSTSKRFWIELFVLHIVLRMTGTSIIDLSSFSTVPQFTFCSYIHTGTYTCTNSYFHILLKVFCWVLQYEYILKVQSKENGWHRTHNSQRNKIPKCMRLEVKYFVKIAIDLKMLRHNVRAFCGRYVYITVLYFLNQCIWWLESASSRNLLGMQHIWLQPDLQY